MTIRFCHVFYECKLTIYILQRNHSVVRKQVWTCWLLLKCWIFSSDYVSWRCWNGVLAGVDWISMLKHMPRPFKYSCFTLPGGTGCFCVSSFFFPASPAFGSPIIFRLCRKWCVFQLIQPWWCISQGIYVRSTPHLIRVFYVRAKSPLIRGIPFCHVLPCCFRFYYPRHQLPTGNSSDSWHGR